MPCALSCVNSIALFCHVQLGISRCDGPAVCRTSLFLSLLSTPVTTGHYTGLHQARVRVSTALSNARQDVRYHRHLGGTPAVRSALRLFGYGPSFTLWRTQTVRSKVIFFSQRQTPTRHLARDLGR